MPVDDAIVLIKKWASRAPAGGRVDPEDPGLMPVLDREIGWPSAFSGEDGETPRRGVMNQLFLEQTALAVDVREYGILPWDDRIDYPADATTGRYGWCQRNGLLYRALVPTGPATSNPTDPVAPGQSVWSALSGTIGRPDAPNTPIGAAMATVINWRWNCPRDNGAAVTAFLFQSRVEGQSWPVGSIRIEPSAAHYSETGLPVGQRRQARVAAVNSQGDSAWSPVGLAQTAATIPDQVQGLIAIPLTSSAMLIWPTPYDGGSAIQGYHVQWKSGSQNWSSARQRTVVADASPYELMGLVENTDYDHRIRAYNAVGNGQWSDIAEDSTLMGFVQKSGDTMEGALNLVTPAANDNSKKAVNSEWVRGRGYLDQATGDARYSRAYVGDVLGQINMGPPNTYDDLYNALVAIIGGAPVARTIYACTGYGYDRRTSDMVSANTIVGRVTGIAHDPRASERFIVSMQAAYQSITVHQVVLPATGAANYPGVFVQRTDALGILLQFSILRRPS